MDKLESEWVPVDSLIPHPKNPRIHPPEQVEQIAESIRRHGWSEPIIARRDDRVIIAGHGRLEAAKSLGLDKVLVRFMDLDPASAMALNLFSNRAVEMGGWDNALLAEHFEELTAAGWDLGELGWDTVEVGEVLAELVPEPTGPPPDPEEPPEVAQSQPGEVYQLGPHRLVCGDSRDAGVWEKLLGDERVQCVWTDPPYGVSYVGSQTKERDPIENDSMDLVELEGFLSDVFGFLLPHTEPGCVWYVAGPNTSPCFAFIKVLLDLDVYKHYLIWLKNRGAFSRCDYHYQHEPIIYGWTPGGGHYWCGRRDLTSVLEFDRPAASPEHPTMKPPELIVHCLENSSLPGWIVCDPFGGSGSTLIASAMCGRVARLIELSPHYCDVIRRRWGRYAADNGLDPGPGAL